jgi:DNA-binding NarL/FixJ family response regulator
MTDHPTARVLIVDGEPLTRFGIAALINLHPLLRVCEEAGDVRAARAACAEEKPDLIVLELALAGGDGLELLRDFARLHPPARTVVVSARDDALSVQRAFRAGARGYVTKQEEATEVLAALEEVFTGGIFASARVANLLVADLAARRAPRALGNLSALSDRELLVFRRIGQKNGATAIARELAVSVKTVETHQGRIKEKLGLPTCAELRRRAERWVASKGGVVRPWT